MSVLLIACGTYKPGGRVVFIIIMAW